MNNIKNLTFSINNWNHLYSLRQAVVHDNQLTGRTLTIHGKVLNSAFLNHQDTLISIRFTQVDTTPDYPLKDTPETDSKSPVLGSMSLNNQQLSSEILVGGNVFEELRKNLMEYAEIEGIHIIVTLGLFFTTTTPDNSAWVEGQSLEIMQLDYAMKGDA